MIHIKTILAKAIENASNAKFYHHNRDIFIKYFESIEQYQDLIEAQVLAAQGGTSSALATDDGEEIDVDDI